MRPVLFHDHAVHQGHPVEGQIAAAIAQVTLDEIPKFYIIMGHEELALEETFLNMLKKENLSYENLNLNTVVPSHASTDF